MNAPMDLPNQIVTVSNGQAVTTSLAIAQGTEVEHKAVIQLVRNYLADLEEFGRVAFEMAPFETAGGTQKREVAVLNEQQSTLLLTYMRNSDIVRRFKKALVKAFFELARSAKPIDPMVALSDPATMRGLLLTYTEKVLFLESTVAEQAPKVEALERFANHEGKHNLRSATKLLGVQEHKLKSWLLIHKWYYRDHGGRLCAYADKITAGYLDAVPVEVPRSDGVQVVQQPVITQKGLAKLAELLARDGLLPKEAA